MSDYLQALENAALAAKVARHVVELTEENARLRAMLKRLEWSRDNHFCPICDEHHADGHQASCELAALLKEAAGD